MISKERLEELIEQGATIYSNEYGEIQLIKENDLILYENGQNNYILYALEPNKKYHNEIFDEDLFETEEDAEWFAEFGCIERTERLELPTWESVYSDLKDYKDGDFYIIDNDHFSFVYNKCYVSPQLFLYTHNEKFNWNANKENYYQACKLAKKIFLGGENE